MKEIICTSCKTKIANVKGSVIFKCPNCGETEIIRCEKCRRSGVRYNCNCGFSGPN